MKIGLVQYKFINNDIDFNLSQIEKALKAYASKEDKDYKALGKYIFKVLKGQNERPSEYVDAPKGNELSKKENMLKKFNVLLKKLFMIIG